MFQFDSALVAEQAYLIPVIDTCMNRGSFKKIIINCVIWYYKIVLTVSTLISHKSKISFNYLSLAFNFTQVSLSYFKSSLVSCISMSLPSPYHLPEWWTHYCLFQRNHWSSTCILKIRNSTAIAVEPSFGNIPIWPLLLNKIISFTSN